MTLESTIERYLVKRVEALGGFTLKTDRIPGRRFLDRTCFLPGGRVIVVELKRPVGGRPRRLQAEMIEQVRALGLECYRCNTKEEVDDAITGVR